MELLVPEHPGQYGVRIAGNETDGCVGDERGGPRWGREGVLYQTAGEEKGRTQALEPMPPYERRLVHIALRNHPEVGTQSVGEGDRRKVTIVPKH